MENERSKLILGFLLGAAAGAVAGYILAGGKKELLAEDLKMASGKIKEELEDYFKHGETLMSDLAQQAGDLFGEKKSS